MPRIRRIAWAIAIAAMATAGVSPAQDEMPGPKAPVRRGVADKADPAEGKATRKTAPEPEAPEKAPAGRRGEKGRDNPAASAGVGTTRNSALARLRETLASQQGGATSLLLPLAPIQKELKLTEKQKALVQQRILAIGQQRQQMWRDAREQGIFDPEDVMAANATLQVEHEEAFASILKPEQRRRLAQIAIQIQGPIAVAQPEIAEQLGLLPNQQEQIQEIVDQQKAELNEMRTKRREILAMGRDPNLDKASRDLIDAQSRGLEQKSEALRAQVVQRIGKAMTKRQKALFNKLLGEPFDLAQLDDAPSRPARAPLKPAAPGGDADAEKGTAEVKSKTATKEKADARNKNADDPGDEAPAHPKPKSTRGSRRPAAPAVDPDR